jgi:hypothetical protein
VSSDSTTEEPRWLLLIHQIPPKPDYLRVKIGRRLQRVGAVPVKNSVYVLPDADQSFEDFQWIRTEIIDGGGDASICRAEFVDGLTADEIRQLFRSARDEDYAAIAAAARELWSSARSTARSAGRPRAKPDDDLARLRRRFAAVVAIDFFEAPERAAAREALDILEAEVEPGRAVGGPTVSARASRADYRGRTWVTRQNVYVDRMASAWLIRRFIDPDARFTFVREEGYRPARGEVRFDMYEGEFTHEGDRCTFEVLVDRFMPNDAALRSIAEVVHDIDLKDAKFGRDEAPGIERVVAGIAGAYPDDSARIERARQLFDELHAVFSRESSASDEQ